MEFSKDSYSDASCVLGTKMVMSKKLSDVKSKFGWMDNYLESEPSLKGDTDMSGNIGFGVLLEHKNIEMNALYNLHFKQKYVGHQGSLQLKINL